MGAPSLETASRNVVLGGRSSNGAIFMEASQEPNLVDNNIVWGTRGNGIYQHDCDELIIALNIDCILSEAPPRRGPSDASHPSHDDGSAFADATVH